MEISGTRWNMQGYADSRNSKIRRTSRAGEVVDSYVVPIACHSLQASSYVAPRLHTVCAQGLQFVVPVIDFPDSDPSEQRTTGSFAGPQLLILDALKNLCYRFYQLILEIRKPSL